MTRRQMIALFTFPPRVTSLGRASVRLSGAAPQPAGGGGCCDPTCCLTGAGTVMVAAQLAPAADPAVACGIATSDVGSAASAGACDPGSCCATSCEAESK